MVGLVILLRLTLAQKWGHVFLGNLIGAMKLFPRVISNCFFHFAFEALSALDCF
jgi:hypothetical protein